MWTIFLDFRGLKGKGLFSFPLGTRKTERGAEALAHRIANEVQSVDHAGDWFGLSWRNAETGETRNMAG